MPRVAAAVITVLLMPTTIDRQGSGWGGHTIDDRRQTAPDVAHAASTSPTRGDAFKFSIGRSKRSGRRKHRILGTRSSSGRSSSSSVGRSSARSWMVQKQLVASPPKARARKVLGGYALDRPGKQRYIVNNSILKAVSPGLGYRCTPYMHDRAPDHAYAPWGSEVAGIDLGHGWIQVGERRFLPFILDGAGVLRELSPRVTQGTRVGPVFKGSDEARATSPSGSSTPRSSRSESASRSITPRSSLRSPAPLSFTPPKRPSAGRPGTRSWTPPHSPRRPPSVTSRSSPRGRDPDRGREWGDDVNSVAPRSPRSAKPDPLLLGQPTLSPRLLQLSQPVKQPPRRAAASAVAGHVSAHLPANGADWPEFTEDQGHIERWTHLAFVENLRLDADAKNQESRPKLTTLFWEMQEDRARARRKQVLVRGKPLKGILVRSRSASPGSRSASPKPSIRWAADVEPVAEVAPVVPECHPAKPTRRSHQHSPDATGPSVKAVASVANLIRSRLKALHMGKGHNWMNVFRFIGKATDTDVFCWQEFAAMCKIMLKVKAEEDELRIVFHALDATTTGEVGVRDLISLAVGAPSALDDRIPAAIKRVLRAAAAVRTKAGGSQRPRDDAEDRGDETDGPRSDSPVGELLGRYYAAAIAREASTPSAPAKDDGAGEVRGRSPAMGPSERSTSPLRPPRPPPPPGTPRLRPRSGAHGTGSPSPTPRPQRAGVLMSNDRHKVLENSFSFDFSDLNKGARRRK